MFKELKEIRNEIRNLIWQYLQGDSGGPLQRILAEPYCMYSIVGVTSFGKFCAFKLSPAIYTRVSSYLDWIETIVWPWKIKRASNDPQNLIPTYNR